MDKKDRRNSFGPVRAVILVIALAVLAYSAYQLYTIFSTYKKAGDEYSSLADDFTRPYSAPSEENTVSGGGGKPLDADARKSRREKEKTEAESAAAESEAQSPDSTLSAHESGTVVPEMREETKAAGSSAEEPAEEKPGVEQTEEKPAEGQTVKEPAEDQTEKVPAEGQDQKAAGKKKKKSGKQTEVYEDADPPLQVNWDELKEINPDIVGWIYVDALPNISYPVLKGEDNDYYLHHTFRREYLFSGSIFEDYLNDPDFSDPNTIVYGHNMKDGSMFNALKQLKNQETYDANPYFWILTPKGNYRYHIYCAATAAAGSDVYLLYRDQDEEFLKWEEKMQEMSEVKNQVDFQKTDKTVILSTCTSDSSYRVVVIGKCVSREQPVKIIPTPTPIPEPDFPVIIDGIDELWADAFANGMPDRIYGETYD